MTKTKPVLGLAKSEPTTVRISTKSRDTLKRLAQEEQTSQAALVEYAVKLLEEEIHFKRIKAGYAALTPEERAEVLAEQDT